MGVLGVMVYVFFILSVGFEFFGIDFFEELFNIKDFKLIFESLKYIKWCLLCELEDVCYFGLIVFCFLLCVFYDLIENLVKLFNYVENVSVLYEYYLWGNMVFVFVICLMDSFVKYCWCLNIIGL